MWRNTRTCVGLDITPDIIRAVVLHRHKGGWAYAASGEAVLETVDGFAADDPTTPSAATAELLDRLQVGRATIAAAVSTRDAAVERLVLPRASRHAIWAAVRARFEERRPFGAEPCRLGWSHPRPAPARTATLNLLVVAARTAAIEDRVAVLAQAGYRPTVIDVEALALANALQAGYPDASPTLLVNLHRTSATYCLVEDDGLAVCGHVPAPPSTGSSIAGEVMAAVRRSSGEMRPIVPSRVLLSGDPRSASLVVDELERETGAPVDLFEPLRGVPRVLEGEEAERLGPAFAVALGLALRTGGDR